MFLHRKMVVGKKWDKQNTAFMQVCQISIDTSKQIMKQNNGQIDHKRRSVHWTLHVLFGQKKTLQVLQKCIHVRSNINPWAVRKLTCFRIAARQTNYSKVHVLQCERLRHWKVSLSKQVVKMPHMPNQFEENKLQLKSRR